MRTNKMHHFAIIKEQGNSGDFQILHHVCVSLQQKNAVRMLKLYLVF